MLHRAVVVLAGIALLGAVPPLGVIAAGTVAVTTYGPDGPVERAVPAAEADALLGRGGEPRLVPGCAPLVWCGPDIASVQPGGPFCESASAWVAHTGPPGQAYTALVGPKPTSEVVCGGFFGPAFDWDLVEMSPLAVGPSLVYEGCYANDWLLHPGSYCPNPFTPGDTFLAWWRFKGVGVATSLGGLDYFLAHSGVACYDMPSPGVLPPGVLPCP